MYEAVFPQGFEFANLGPRVVTYFPASAQVPSASSDALNLTLNIANLGTTLKADVKLAFLTTADATLLTLQPLLALTSSHLISMTCNDEICKLIAPIGWGFQSAASGFVYVVVSILGGDVITTVPFKFTSASPGVVYTQPEQLAVLGSTSLTIIVSNSFNVTQPKFHLCGTEYAASVGEQMSWLGVESTSLNAQVMPCTGQGPFELIVDMLAGSTNINVTHMINASKLPEQTFVGFSSESGQSLNVTVQSDSCTGQWQSEIFNETVTAIAHQGLTGAACVIEFALPAPIGFGAKPGKVRHVNTQQEFPFVYQITPDPEVRFTPASANLEGGKVVAVSVSDVPASIIVDGSADLYLTVGGRLIPAQLALSAQGVIEFTFKTPPARSTGIVAVTLSVNFIDAPPLCQFEFEYTAAAPLIKLQPATGSTSGGTLVVFVSGIRNSQVTPDK